ICSPVIANLALDGLEQLLKAHYPPNTKRAQRAKVNLVRYADDFIITGSSHELLEHEVKPLVEQFLGTRGLELSPTKTHITSIEDGFDFLDNIYASTLERFSSNQGRRMAKTSFVTSGQSWRPNPQPPRGN